MLANPHDAYIAGVNYITGKTDIERGVLKDNFKALSSTQSDDDPAQSIEIDSKDPISVVIKRNATEIVPQRERQRITLER